MAQPESRERDSKKDCQNEHLERDKEKRQRDGKIQVELQVIQGCENESAHYDSNPESCRCQVAKQQAADKQQCFEKSTQMTTSDREANNNKSLQQANSRPNELSLLNPFRSEWVSLSTSPCSSIQSNDSVSFSRSNNWQTSNNNNNNDQANCSSLHPFSSYCCSTSIVIASPTKPLTVESEGGTLRMPYQNQLKSLSSSKLSCPNGVVDERDSRISDWQDDYDDDDDGGYRNGAATSSLLRCSLAPRLQICRLDQDIINNNNNNHNKFEALSQTAVADNSSTNDNSRSQTANLLNVKQTIPRTFSASVLASGASSRRRQSGGHSRASGNTAANGEANSSTASSQQRFSFWESLVSNSSLEKHRSKSQYLHQYQHQHQHQISCLDYNSQQHYQKRSSNAVSAATTTNELLVQHQRKHHHQAQQEFTQNQQAQLLQLPTFWTERQQTRKR